MCRDKTSLLQLLLWGAGSWIALILICLPVMWLCDLVGGGQLFTIVASALCSVWLFRKSRDEGAIARMFGRVLATTIALGGVFVLVGVVIT